ncbi:hypothetical protein ACFV23_42070, partial [Streptomyces sp. NPDC059627]
MEPTESAAPGARLPLRRRACAWRGSRWTGRGDRRPGLPGVPGMPVAGLAAEARDPLPLAAVDT